MRRNLYRWLTLPHTRQAHTDGEVVMNTRKGFGSFHSEDIEKMVHDLSPPDVYSMISDPTLEDVRVITSTLNGSNSSSSSSSSSLLLAAVR